MTSVNTTVSKAILIIEPNKKVFFFGKLRYKEKLLFPNPSSKSGALYGELGLYLNLLDLILVGKS